MVRKLCPFSIALAGFLGCWDFTTLLAQPSPKASPSFPKEAQIALDSAELFLQMDQGIHAIAFDGKGSMYVGGGRSVFRVSPDKQPAPLAVLTNTSPRTRIWSITLSAGGELFCAAHDRIVRITPSGEQTVVVREDFSGPCGVTDLRFDGDGNLLAAYDNIVARYDTAFRKTILVDGSKVSPPIQWAVGIELAPEKGLLYVADCTGGTLYQFPYARQCQVPTRTFQTAMGQYLTRNSRGELFLTFPGPPGVPEFLMLQKDSAPHYLCCAKPPLQNRAEYKKTVAVGGAGFDTNALYCVIGKKVYCYPLPH